MKVGMAVRRMAFVVLTVCAGTACAEGGPEGREVAPALPGGQAFQASAAREATEATEATGAEEATVFAAAAPLHPATAPARSFGVGSVLSLLLLATLVATARPALRRH